MITKLKYGNTNTFLIRGESVSLLLDSGECFVGDLEPMEYLDAYEEKAELQRDWERIMGHSPKVIYYAHRPPKFM